MVKLGIFVFANDSGLGAQTRRLTQMLKPHKILVINSEGFSKNKTQNWHWYDAFQGYRVDGFPSDREINIFLREVTHVLVCENPLNFHLFSEAKRRGIKTFCQSNYEFCDNLANENLPLPDKFLMPSHWKVGEMQEMFGEDKVTYLPPPIDASEFAAVREVNFARTSQQVELLHIIGTLAAHDRNGTLDLLGSLNLTNANFRLTIKSQHDLPSEYMTSDRRVRYQIGNEVESQDLYRDYDALILPRRYGGLSLTANEALMSGLPVIMPDIEPNNKLLPREWLVDSVKVAEFEARDMIDVYSARHKALAQKIDWICEANFDIIRPRAFEIGYNNFSVTQLQEQYQNLWSQ